MIDWELKSAPTYFEYPELVGHVVPNFLPDDQTATLVTDLDNFIKVFGLVFRLYNQQLLDNYSYYFVGQL